MNRNTGIRGVSVDLDGTLIRSDCRLPGVRVVMNTTHNIGSVQELYAAWFHRPRDLYQRRADSSLAARAIRRYILPCRPT